jgi:1-hydroxy-2-isopentenylcarotenoid 3,4-desaturase
MKKKVLIIGAGFGGLATAALLGKEGYEVTVLEKNSQPGGRAMIYEDKGFSFDMGPSWYLMPDVYERFFAEFGKKPEDFFQLKRLDPNYRIFFSKDEFIDIKKTVEENFATFEKLEPGSTEKFKEFLKLSEENYKIAVNDFVYRNYSSIKSVLDKELIMKGRNLNALEGFDHYLSKFFKSEKIKKIFQHTVISVGGSPKKIPALYAIMSHVDFNLGVWYPMGGMNRVHQALRTIGEEFHVTYQYDSPVEKIVVENSQTKGVIVNGNMITADIVVSNADYPYTETKLLEKKHQTYSEKYWSKKTIAPSAFILYLGIKGKVKNLQHHNLFFKDDWQEQFENIFTKREISDDPTYYIYICAPSKTDSSVAPEGNENLFILVPIAPGIEDTEEFRKDYSEKILKHVEEIIKEKISDRIITQKVHTINDYSSLYNAYKGTALGLAHNLMQSTILRPKNKSKKVENLFYVGQYTIPGVGVPMCLISAQLVKERIVNESK